MTDIACSHRKENNIKKSNKHIKRSYKLPSGQCTLKPQSDAMTYTPVLLKCKRQKNV